MATTKGMNSLDLVAAIDECAGLLPLWIHKIYQLENRSVVIRLNAREKKKFTLLIEPGRRMHLIAAMPDVPTFPPSFAMLLRKYLQGGYVSSITQIGLQRIVEITVQKASGTWHLIAEIFDDGNIILTNDAYTIIQPLRQMRFRDRTIIPGEVYRFPPPDVSTAGEEECAALLAASDLDIVRFLAVSCFLGGAYAEYLCRTRSIPKDLPASEADPATVLSAIHTLIDEVKTKKEPVVTNTGVYPIPIGEPVNASGFVTFNDALASYFPFKEGKKEQKQKTTISREERIKKQQETAILAFKKKIAQNEEIAEKIYENYLFVSDIIATLQKASAGHSWQEIAEIISTAKNGPATKIRRVIPEQAAVEIDLKTLVIIRIHESVEENCGRYYEQAKKFKRKLKGAEEAIKKGTPVRKRHSVTYNRPKKRWYHRFRWCFTSDNVLMVGGRDAGQNEELVKRYMEGNDSFVHADVFGAGVVILKGETDCWDEVAQFAASFSGAWRSGHHTADVYAVSREQVSKTAESGEYVSRGAFIIRGERRWFHNTGLRVAIGLMEHPETQIIGGPPSAISKKTGVMVEICPGMYEPNDVAKKIVKLIRDTLTPDKQKALKFALHTEAVAAFVPSGGSDIVSFDTMTGTGDGKGE
ncbi:MAG: NFACT family protein [Methanospirillaceae archaeon]|nr:NFACT family protein [Methanospirillaceae archaeon]